MHGIVKQKFSLETIRLASKVYQITGEIH